MAWDSDDFTSAADALVDAVQHPVGFPCRSSTLFARIDLVFAKALRSLSAELLPSWVDPSLCCAPGLCFSRCKTLFLSLLELHKVFVSLLFQPIQIFWQGGALFQSVHFSTLLSSANFIRVCLIPSSRSLMKLLKSIGPNINA